MRRAAAAAALVLAAAVAGFWFRPSSDASRLALLRSVLDGGDDNDPRLDQAFTDLSPRAKELFREEYRRTAPELRNRRGTIVYLLGRELDGPEDWRFLMEVLAEPPCLSLADCSRPAAGPAQPGDGVTLAYPALVALEQARRSSGRPEAAEVLEAAKSSPQALVARKARQQKL